MAEPELLPGSAGPYQEERGSLTCVLHGLQKGPVHQLPQVLPINTDMNYFMSCYESFFQSKISIQLKTKILISSKYCVCVSLN